VVVDVVVVALAAYNYGCHSTKSITSKR